MTLLLDSAYVLGALLLGAPYLLVRAVRRRPMAPPLRRLGFVDPPRPGSSPVIWVHAVSVGEVRAVRSLLEGLAGLGRPLLTCTTVTGLQVARGLYPDVDVRESPFDLSFAVRRFMRRVRPELVVLVELELWPNHLRILASRRIPVVVVNGKLSPRSAAGYRRLLRIMPAFLDGVRHFLMQSEEHAARLRGLGIPEARISVTGNVKFDNVRFRDPGPERGRLRDEHGLDRGAFVFVAGSTHPGEEEALLDAALLVREQVPGLRVVLAPRHPGRVRDVLECVRHKGLRPGLRSRPGEGRDPEVLVVDTMGELPILYGLGDAAFVGGTLVPVGGHNVLEPAEVGVPLLVGPHLHTVAETAEALRAAGALQVVRGPSELASRLLELVREPRAARRASAGARAVIDAHRGSVGRTLSVLQPLLVDGENPKDV